MNPLAVRWMKFNFVGALGVGVQTAALALYANALHLPYLAAVAMAVETAVLHNFVWHERFTWKDHVSRAPRAVVIRFLTFHLGNGLVSLAGNLVFMRMLVGAFHLRLMVANLISIALCYVLNFAIAEWFVFRR